MFLVYLAIIASFATTIVSTQLIPQSPCAMVRTQPCELDLQFSHYKVVALLNINNSN
jgi:hypothetical protein